MNKTELERVYHLLKEHRKTDFQAFYDMGFELESTYGCCGQCVVAPFVKLLDLDEDLFKHSSAYCAGIGQHGQFPCGAFNGGAMLISHFFGREIGQMQGDIQTSKDIFRNNCRMVRMYEDAFNARYGGACCKDVQTKLFGRTFNLMDMEHDAPLFEELGGHRDKCTDVVGTGARTLAGIIYEELCAMFET